MRVEINQSIGAWLLVVKHNGIVVKTWSHKRLIEALDTACRLQLHVDNENELPIRQYNLQSEVTMTGRVLSEAA